MKRHLILGPPGTGKTTKLLQIFEDALNRGLDPRQIAFVSFTKKAAYEAMERADAKFGGINRESAPYISTLHSIGYHRMGLRKESVMQAGDWATIGHMINMRFSGSGKVSDDGVIPAGISEGDMMRFQIGLARARRIDPIEHYLTLPAELRLKIKLSRFKQLLAQLDYYKNENGMSDFSDMLEYGINSEPLTNVKVAIVDEAQDLSAQQWQFVNTLFANVDELYIAGDDDQAIYRWSGADIDTFLALPGEKRVLERSWRLPRQIWDYSNQFTARIKNRYQKDWHADDRDGTVKFIEEPNHAPVGKGGNWLILVRNVYQMNPLVEMLERGGVPYATKGRPAVDETHIAAIRTWESLRKGKSVSKYAASNVYALLRGNIDIKRGNKDLSSLREDFVTMDELVKHHGLLVDPNKPWFETFGRGAAGIPLDRVNYYRRILQNGEEVTQQPRVNVSTIHGCKGGEADNVLVLNEMARQTWDGFQRNPEDEHRTMYVAATRAKQNLYLCRTKARLTYPFPLTA